MDAVPNLMVEYINKRFCFTFLLVSDRLRRPVLPPLRPLRWQARHWTLAKASIKTGTLTGWHVVPYCPGSGGAWLPEPHCQAQHHHRPPGENVSSAFPPIAASDNSNCVTPKTVSYIHTLIFDCISTNFSKSPHSSALRNENMTVTVTELEKLTPVVFSSELSACLVACYEGLRGDT